MLKCSILLVIFHNHKVITYQICQNLKSKHENNWMVTSRMHCIVCLGVRIKHTNRIFFINLTLNLLSKYGHGLIISAEFTSLIIFQRS